MIKTRVIRLRNIEGPNAHEIRLRSIHSIHSEWKSKRSWLYMCCACVIATWRLGLRTPPVSTNWKKRTHQKNCLLHHEPFVVWLDGVQEDIEPKWYRPLWCHDPEKNRRHIWFNIGSEFKARWKKEKDDFSVSETGGSGEKIRVIRTSNQKVIGSGGSRGGVRGTPPPPLFLGQTGARNFFFFSGDPTPPPPSYLKVWIRHW